jgi:hypothetical protein
MKQIAAESPLTLFVDLHGHFRKKNIFIYGSAPQGDDSEQQQQALTERLYPFLFSRFAPCFSFADSVFKLSNKGPKRGSARMVVWRELGVLNSFTVESTFSGMDTGPHAGQHLTPALLRQTGAAIAQTLQEYCQVTGNVDLLVAAMAELKIACSMKVH